jgi:triacylglycerol lipase
VAKLAETAIRRFAGLDPFPLPEYVPLRYPIVLMHGFGILAGMRRGGHLYAAASHLRMHGVAAFAPNVSPYNTVEFRMGMWRRRIQHVLRATGRAKVNLVAHSMGGLDARYLVSVEGFHRYVASLTTIATPHHGTSIAGLVLSQPDVVREALADLADWIGARAILDGEADFRTAIRQLTPEYVQHRFNEQVKDHPNVKYWSFGGVAGKGTRVPINPVLRLGNSHIYSIEGRNDGLVSAESSRWGQWRGIVEADHALQVGLSITPATHFDSRAFFLGIARFLSSEGL